MELACKHWPALNSERAKWLLLHGMGGTGALWRPLAALLEDDFSVLAPDQRGHGESRVASTPGGRAPASYTPLDYGQDVVETVEKQSFQPCWVLGHSMGVRTACAFAHLRPDWVKGLVLIDLGFSGVAGGGLGENLAQFIRVLPHHFASRQAAREFMHANCPDPSIAQYLMAVSVSGPNGVHFPFDHGALAQTILAARDVSVREWIRAAAERGTPILILRGGKSLVWSHEEFEKERALLAGYPSVQFEEFTDAGHGLPFEKRTELAARLRSFASS